MNISSPFYIIWLIYPNPLCKTSCDHNYFFWLELCHIAHAYFSLSKKGVISQSFCYFAQTLDSPELIYYIQIPISIHWYWHQCFNSQFQSICILLLSIVSKCRIYKEICNILLKRNFLHKLFTFKIFQDISLNVHFQEN